MKANLFFEIGENGAERAVVQLMTDDGEPLGELPCIKNTVVSKQYGKATEITITLVVDRQRVTVGAPRAEIPRGDTEPKPLPPPPPPNTMSVKGGT